MTQTTNQLKPGAARAITVTILVTLFSVSSLVHAESVAKAAGLCRRLLDTTVERIDRHLAIPNEETWSPSPDTETQIQAVFAGDQLDDTGKIRRSIELLFMDRARAEGSFVRQRLMRTALDRAFARNDWYSNTLGKIFGLLEGPHYSFIANRVSIADVLDATDPGTTFTYISMLTKAFDRNYFLARTVTAMMLKSWNGGDLVFKLPVVPILQNRIARSSIGSQWEFTHRLPPAVRDQMLAAVREHREADSLAAEDRALFTGLLESGLWSRLAQVVSVMQARGDVPAGAVEPIAFFDEPSAYDLLRHPLKQRQLGELRRAVGKATKRLLKLVKQNKPFPGYLTLVEDDLRLAALMMEPRDNRVELTAMIARRRRVAMTPEQTDLVARLERDFRLRDLTDAQKINEIVVESSLKFAHLPKEDFIRKVELIYETDVKHLMRKELLNPFTKMKIAMAVEASYEIITGGHSFMARDVGLFVHFVSSFF